MPPTTPARKRAEPTICMAVRLPLSLASQVDAAAAARYSKRSETVRQLVLARLGERLSPGPAGCSAQLRRRGRKHRDRSRSPA